MPNCTTVGELGLAVGRELARDLVPEVSAILTTELTSILERGALLTQEALPGLARFLSREAREKLPQISRTLGLPAKDQGGTLLIGKPLVSSQCEYSVARAGDLVIYEPRRNLTIHADGSLNVASSTPSGQRIISQNYFWKAPLAETSTNIRYIDKIGHEYPGIKYSYRSGGLRSTVITKPDSRQLGVGQQCWNPERTNFWPSQKTIDAIKTSKPVEVSDDLVGKTLGSWVHSTRKYDGWLVGFDKKAGEAIVSSEDWPGTGVSTWERDTVIVKNLDQFYPVQLVDSKKSLETLYRNSLGNIFGAQPVHGGYRMIPSRTTYAFPPSEIGMDDMGTRLSEVLGLASNTGMRALGGYRTDLGGRIPIAIVGL